MSLKTYIPAALFFIFLGLLGYFLYTPSEKIKRTYDAIHLPRTTTTIRHDYLGLYEKFMKKRKAEALQRTTKILCNYLERYNLTVIKQGFTTCTVTDHVCFCVTPAT